MSAPDVSAVITKMTERIKNWLLREYPDVAVDDATRIVVVNALLRIAVTFTVCHSAPSQVRADLANMSAFIHDCAPLIEAALAEARAQRTPSGDSSGGGPVS